MSLRVPAPEAATRRANRRPGRGAASAAFLVTVLAGVALATPAHAEVATSCEFLEISAKQGDKPVIDPKVSAVIRDDLTARLLELAPRVTPKAGGAGSAGGTFYQCTRSPACSCFRSINYAGSCVDIKIAIFANGSRRGNRTV